jgi:hypothetical protein
VIVTAELSNVAPDAGQLEGELGGLVGNLDAIGAALTEDATLLGDAGSVGATRRQRATPNSRPHAAPLLTQWLASARSQTVISRCRRASASLRCSSRALPSPARRCAGRSAASQAGRSKRGVRDAEDGDPVDGWDIAVAPFKDGRALYAPARAHADRSESDGRRLRMRGRRAPRDGR